MKNITQKLFSALLSLVLTLNILACLARFTSGEPLPASKLVLEAPILRYWIAWYQWVRGGGTWSGGEDPRPKPDGN